jgi:uncharacterized protein
MTPDERQLIAGLFERMRAFELAEKDRDAEALINQAVRAMPDAPYMLVQSVLVQEQALEAANNRVQDLEARLRALEKGGEGSQPGTGSFLGGLFGGAKPAAAEARPGSVPAIGSRAGGQPSAWAAAPSSGGSQPQAQQTQAASGGFMRSAMATAAGVAGGMLLADGIRNMMGGGAHAATPAATSTSSDGSGGGKQAAEEASENQDNDQHDAADDSGDSGGDWGGDSLDI